MPEFGTNIQEVQIQGVPTIVVSRLQVSLMVGPVTISGPTAGTLILTNPGAGTVGVLQFGNPSQFSIANAGASTFIAGNGIGSQFIFRTDGINQDLLIQPNQNGTLPGIIATGMANSGMNLTHRVAINDVAYAILSSDYIIAYTTLTAPRTATLPTAVGRVGQQYILKDESGSAGTQNITLVTTSAQTIDGAANKVINTAFGVIRVYSNGANWFTW